MRLKTEKEIQIIQIRDKEKNKEYKYEWIQKHMEPSVHFDKSKDKKNLWQHSHRDFSDLNAKLLSPLIIYFEMQLPRVVSSCGWRFMSFYFSEKKNVR